MIFFVFICIIKQAKEEKKLTFLIDVDKNGVKMFYENYLSLQKMKFLKLKILHKLKYLYLHKHSFIISKTKNINNMWRT